MQLKRIRIYPIKSLEGLELDQSGFTSAGALEFDRRWCLVYGETDTISPDSVFMTKSEPSSVSSRLMRIGVRYGDSPAHISLQFGESDSASFQLPGDSDPLAKWFSEQLGMAIRLNESTELGWPDTAVYGDDEFASAASGPTVISTSTLKYLSERLEISPDELFLRFRTNLLVHDEDLPPFGEDRLEKIKLGDVQLAVVRPVMRCPVPARDLDSGEYDRNFTKRFIEAKTETEIGKSLPRDKLYSASVFTCVQDPNARLSSTP